jgi:hypothetical protein
MAWKLGWVRKAYPTMVKYKLIFYAKLLSL